VTAASKTRWNFQTDNKWWRKLNGVPKLRRK
jgi:hypothetical protein